MHVKDLAIDFRKMGYTPFTIKIERPNYYRLDDGSILRVYSILNAVTLDASRPDGMSVNEQNVVVAFVPKKLRGEPTNQVYTLEDYNKNMDIEDMKFEIIFEDFNEYDLDGKHILSIKTSLSQVSRVKLYNARGEPIYLVNTAPIPKIKTKKK